MQDTLFVLVKSMSASEIIELKKTLVGYELGGRKNKFIHLLEALLELHTYNYKALSDRTVKYIAASSLSSFKTQLKQKVLTFLRERNSHHITNWHRMLEDAQILCDKGLYREAQSLLDIVKNESRSRGSEYYSSAALRLEGRTLQHLHQKDLFSAILYLGEESVREAKSLLKSAEIYSYYMSITAITLQGNLVRDEKELLFLQQHKEGIPGLDLGSLSAHQAHLYLTAKFQISRILGQFEQMRKYATMRLELYESNKEYFHKYQSQNVPIILMDHMDSFLTHGPKEIYDSSLFKYKRFIDDYYSNVSFYYDLYTHQFNAFIIQHSDNKNDCVAAVNNLTSFYEQGVSLNLLIKKKLEITLAWGYFKLLDYDRASDYCSKLTGEDLVSEVADYIKDFAKLFTMIVLFEKAVISEDYKDISFLRSSATSSYNFFRKKKDKDYRLELEFSNSFRRFDTLSNFQDRLIDLRHSVANWVALEIPYILNINDSFDLLSWLDRHISSQKKS